MEISNLGGGWEADGSSKYLARDRRVEALHGIARLAASIEGVDHRGVVAGALREFALTQYPGVLQGREPDPDVLSKIVIEKIEAAAKQEGSNN